MWILGVLAVILVVVALFGACRFRRFSWYPVIWIPLIGIFSSPWLLILASPRQSDGGLGVIIVAIVISPSLIYLASLLWDYPRIWNGKFIVLGIVTLIICGWLLFDLTTRTVTFIVTDPAGKPISDVPIVATYSNLVEATQYRQLVTNQMGEVTIHPPKSRLTLESYFDATAGGGQWSEVSCFVDSRAGQIGRIDGHMQITVYWNERKERIRAFIPNDGNQDLVIPLVVTANNGSMELGLSAVWRKQWPISEMHDLSWKRLIDIESFLAQHKESFLANSSIEDFGDLSDFAHGIYLINEAANSESNDAENYRGRLCEYLTGADPKEPVVRAEALRSFARTRANRFIEFLEPHVHEGRAYGVLGNLGSLACPAVPKFAVLYPTLDEDTQKALLGSLFQIGTSPVDVLFLLEIDDNPRWPGNLFNHFADLMRFRSRRDIKKDRQVIEEWIKKHPSKLTQEQITSLNAALEDRR